MKIQRLAAVPLLLLMLLFGMAAIAPPFGAGPETPFAKHINPQLVAETDAVRPGDTVMLALVMNTDKGWHGYWQNGGDAGFGMQADWTLPAGITTGALQYPVPSTLYVGDLMNYVYMESYTVLVPLTVGRNVAEGATPITVKLDWLVCTDKICVPESGTYQTDITVSRDARAMNTVRSARFDTYRQKLPAPLGSEGTFTFDGNKLRLAIPYPASGRLQAPYFFPATQDAFDYSEPLSFYRSGDNVIVEGVANDKNLAQLSGILKIAPDIGLSVAAIRGDVPAGGVLTYTSPSPVEQRGTEDTPGSTRGAFSLLLLAGAFGGALLGGLILNIMPCVFPILSLKAISLAKIGSDERAARREALAYSAGVVLVSIALGAAMLGLRGAGEQVGWAFQLQDPRIVFILLIVILAIAFNLAGLFEIGNLAFGNKLASSGGTGGAFWTGVLAAFVATPCTGPFMAVAMGTALILPAYAALLVFAGLGLGLALPFLLLGFVPALRRKLPRPGAWMGTFRKIMAVPMFVTALALVWVLGRQAGSDTVVMAVAASMIAILFLWWAGLRQRAGKSATLVLVLPLMLVTIFCVFMLPQNDKRTIAMDTKTVLSKSEIVTSEPFSQERLDQLRAEKRPVFAYFTADWCITCKVNEASALQRTETAKAFADKNVAVLKGDWTRRNPKITRYLEANGRSGVPLYVYYPAGGGAQILSQILTVDELVALTMQ